MWGQLFFLILVLVMGWFLLRMIKNNPEAFSKKSFHKSFWTMGWLALFLIAFIAFLVAIVRN